MWCGVVCDSEIRLNIVDMSQIIHSATVVAVRGGELEVEFVRSGACAGCHARGMCGGDGGGMQRLTVADTAFVQVFGDSSVSSAMSAPSSLVKREVGDRVEVVIRTGVAGLAVAVAYLVPVVLALVLLLVLGAVGVSDLVAGVVALGVIVVYFVGLKIFGKRLDRRLTIEVR